MNLPKLLRIALGATATLALATTVESSLTHDWTTAGWALTAALTMTSLAIHTCPKPAPRPIPDPERGTELIVFTGGPLDGAEILTPTPHIELLLTSNHSIDIRGTTYRIDSVHHTAYNATAEAQNS